MFEKKKWFSFAGSRPQRQVRFSDWIFVLLEGKNQKEAKMSSPSAGKRRMDTDVMKLYDLFCTL